MKPAAFAYHAPRSLSEAMRLLAEHGDEAKLLAGGQSLVPMMNFRLVRPTVVIDLNRVEELRAITVSDTQLSLGAMVRSAELTKHPEIERRWPLLAIAARHIGHAAIRSRGTVGGSVSHADPHAELPATLVALDASFIVASARGTRQLAASAFFIDFYTTAMAADEILTEIVLPQTPAAAVSGFAEFTRTHGEYALAGAAVQLVLDDQRRCTAAAIGIFGGGATPLRSREVEQTLIGTSVGAGERARVAQALAALSDPPEPIDYRRALVAEMTERAIARALEYPAR
jgi:CO/xanthine dehydrogenase FAD-binding subunit